MNRILTIITAIYFFGYLAVDAQSKSIKGTEGEWGAQAVNLASRVSIKEIMRIP